MHGGFSGFGIAIGAGGAISDENCELIELSKQAERLYYLGVVPVELSLQIMCLNEKFKAAAGPLCIE